MLILAVILYAKIGKSWWLFAILFLAPDLSLIGYLADAQIGSIIYNVAHTLIGPFILATVGLFAFTDIFSAVALIWIAHIGFDRTLGYGLKYAAGFSFTHLGRIGASSRDLM